MKNENDINKWRTLKSPAILMAGLVEQFRTDSTNSRYRLRDGAIAVFFLVTAFTSGIASAGPILEGFSNSKTKDDKTMFLVKPGEKITFSVRAEGAPINKWTVNKKAAKNPAGMGLKSNSLFWTVPNEKGIWEIHVTARGDKGGEVHAEWVVSTLTKKEAPTFFDYFTDKQYAKRKGNDPWGRPLPKWGTWALSAAWTEWQELWGFLPGGAWGKSAGDWAKKIADVDCSGCFAQAPNEAPVPNYKRHLMVFLRTKTEIEYGTWKFRYRFPNGKAQMKGGKTHLRFYYAHTRGYYGYSFWYAIACDGFQAFRVGANKFDNDEKFPVDTKWHEVTLIRTKDSEIYCFIDGIFKFRGKTARKTWKEDVSMYIGLSRYQPDRYPKDTLYVDGIEAYEGRYLFPTKRVEVLKDKVIIAIGGRDVGLKEIAEAIKDPSVFSYDPVKKQAVCKAHLWVKGGADLILFGETLNLEPSGKFYPALFVGANATLRADKSNIIGSVEFRSLDVSQTEEELFSSGPNYRIYSKRPFGISLTDTKLISIEGPLPIPAMAYGRWKFDGVIFDEDDGITTGHRTEFLLAGNTTRLNVYNSYFGDKDSRVRVVGTGKNPGILGLVNCKFGDLKATKGAGIATKYYLDVRVVDTKGKPVAGAKVTVRNEVDDFKFPAENCKEFQPHGGGDSSYLSESVVPRKISYTTRRDATTGADGHTPLPKDVENTLILTDFVQNAGAKKQFAYRLTIEADGKTKVITGVNPGTDWLRAGPDKPAYTITAVLDGKTVTESDLKK